MVHCGSAFEPDASGLPCYCTSICVLPDVIGALAVWIKKQKNKKNKKLDEILPSINTFYNKQTMSNKQMMVIALITIKFGFVPLIEGLYAHKVSSIILDLRLSVVCVHIFCFSFAKENLFQRKK